MQNTKFKTFLVVSTLIVFGCSTLLAQSSGFGSATAASSTEASAASPVQPNASMMVGQSQQQQQASTSSEPSPIFGAKTFGLGFSGPSQSYVIPSFQWTSLADTNLGYASGQEQPIYQSTAVASLTLQRVAQTSQFNLSYAGGAQVYNRNVNLNGATSPSHYGTFQQLSLGEAVGGRRWNLFFGDQGSYLPESPAGFTGFGGLQSFNSGLGGAALSTAGNMNSLLQPDQSILTFARRFSNTSVAQYQYDLSSRTIVTVTGSYGILQFLEPGFIDQNYASVLAGFTHALGPRDSVGVTYLQSLIHFHSAGQNIRENGALFSYGRRLVGHLSFEASGGPLYEQFGAPTGGTVSEVLLTTEDSIHYRLQRTDFSTTFSRSTTGGSGVMRGAETDLVDFHIGRRFTRKTYLNWSVGYSRDRSLTAPLVAAGLARSSGWEGEMSFNHRLTPYMSFYIQYGVQRQVANQALCVASQCGVAFLRQVGGFGFNWHTPPRHLR